MKFSMVAAFTILPLCHSMATSEEVALHGESAIRFATEREGIVELRRGDLFLKALSPFDRQARMKTDREVSTDELVRFIAANVRPWSKEDREKVSLVVVSLREKLQRLKLNLPKPVLLVQTTGKEEGGAAYCRGDAIVLPESRVALPPDRLERLLTHELFHILSRHNPKLRESLYSIIGFHPCPPVKLPAYLRPRQITNPDAPTLDYYIELAQGERKVKAVPVLYSSVEKYNARRGGSFFRYLQFRLMVVRGEGEVWQPVMDGDEAILLDPKKTPSYLEQIGDNTGYIIHPDEILADNFVHLVQRKKNLKTPRIVEEMRKLLSK